MNRTNFGRVTALAALIAVIYGINAVVQGHYGYSYSCGSCCETPSISSQGTR